MPCRRLAMLTLAKVGQRSAAAIAARYHDHEGGSLAEHTGEADPKWPAVYRAISDRETRQCPIGRQPI